MPTMHIPEKVYDQVESKLVELTTKHRVPIKMQAVLVASMLKGVDNVTIEDVVSKEYLDRAVNVG